MTERYERAYRSLLGATDSGQMVSSLAMPVALEIPTYGEDA